MHRRALATDRTLRTLIAAMACVLSLVVAACSGGVVLEPTEGPVLEARKVAQAAVPTEQVTGIELGTPAETALEASRVFFDSAQIVVLASSSEPEAYPRAASIAVTLGTPLLLTAAPGENTAGQALSEQEGGAGNSGGLNGELLRLGTRGIITVGEVSLHQIDATSLVVQPAPEGLGELSKILNQELTEVPPPAAADEMGELENLQIGQIYRADELGEGPAKYGSLPETLPAERNQAVTVLSSSSTRHYGALATAKAAGAQIFVGNDPGALVEVVDHVALNPDQPVVGFGEDLQDQQRLQRLVRTLQTGAQLPTGAQRVFRSGDTDFRLLTLEGQRIMGEEGIEHAGDAFSAAQERTATLEDDLSAPVIPGVEVVVNRENRGDLDYWVDQARKHEQYLILTIKPRGTITEEIEQLEPWLTDPLVGIRLDLREREVVSSGALNDASSYLRRLVRDERLPQKLLILDLGDDVRIDTDVSLVPSTPEVAVTIAIDEQANELWQEAREVVKAKVFWAMTLDPLVGEDGSVEYSDFSDISGRSEINLVAYR